MTERDAQELIRMIEANWQFDLGPVGRNLWRQELVKFDADLATKAVVGLAKNFPHRLRLADLMEALRMHVRNVQMAERQWEIAKEGKRGYAPPEWVWVWSWARFYRAPQEMRSFPQQLDFGDPFNCMTTEEYEVLRDEWFASGAPKSKRPIPAEMSA